MQVKHSTSQLVGVCQGLATGALTVFLFPQKIIDKHLFMPIVKQTSKANQEIIDAGLGATGETFNALTAPAGNPKIFTLIPRAVDLMLGSVALRREWFRDAYSIVASKYQEQIEKKFHLQQGSLNSISRLGSILEEDLQGGKITGLKKKFMDEIVSKFEKYYLQEYGLSRSLQIYEKYEIKDVLKTSGKEIPNKLKDASPEYALYEFLNDNTIASKGIITTISGILYALGGTTPAENIKGAFLAGAGFQLLFLRPGGKRVNNPIEVKSSTSESFPGIKGLDPRILTHAMLEHVLTQQSMRFCFGVLNSCALYDLVITIGSVVSGDTKHDAAEAFGKAVSYFLFGITNNLKPLIQKRNANYRTLLDERIANKPGVER